MKNFRALKDRVLGGVVDVSFDLATIECKFPRFEEVDIAGYVTRGEMIKPLGVVLSGGRSITVNMYNRVSLDERQRIELCEGRSFGGI